MHRTAQRERNQKKDKIQTSAVMLMGMIQRCEPLKQSMETAEVEGQVASDSARYDCEQ